MWRSGQTRRRREAALTAMLRTAAHNGCYREPWRFAPQVWEHFGGEGEVLAELYRLWRTTLAGEVYVALESGRGDLGTDVALAYRRTLERHGDLRRVLESHADHPAVSASLYKERVLLQAATSPLLPEAA